MKGAVSKRGTSTDPAGFIRALAHELLTPIAVARERISQILDGLFGDLTPQQRQVLSEALRQVDQVGRIIDQMAHSFHRE